MHKPDSTLETKSPLVRFQELIVGILIKEPDIVIPALSLGERAYVTIETFQQINHSHKYMYHSQFYAFNDPHYEYQQRNNY